MTPSEKNIVRSLVAVAWADGNRKSDEWLVLFVAGMWFQDLWNYDFRRTEMCIIPYGTQMGEISFCAYNTGVGFRQIIEKMKKTATVAEWYKTRGRHPVYAKNQHLPLPPHEGPLSVVVGGTGIGQPQSPLHQPSLPDGATGRRRLRLVS